GRHVRPGSLPPDRPPAAWPGPMPLGAPVFAAPAAEDDGAAWTDQDSWTDQDVWAGQDSWEEPRDRWDDGRLPIRRRPDLPSAPDRGWPSANDTLLLESSAAGARRLGTPRGLISRRTATIGVPALVLVAVAVLALAMLTGHSMRFGPLAANQGQDQGQNQNSYAPQLPLTE